MEATRDFLRGKQTKGVARVTPNGHTISVKTMAGREVIAEAAEIFMDNTVRRANAALYAEAHNVANRTGMWPVDMEARLKDLEAALDRTTNVISRYFFELPDAYMMTAKATMDEARALLNK